MASNKKGSQRNVYLSNEEWIEHDKLSLREGLKGETSFMISLFRKYLSRNIKRKSEKT